jgi:hypothetical protein
MALRLDPALTRGVEVFTHRRWPDGENMPPTTLKLSVRELQDGGVLRVGYNPTSPRSATGTPIASWWVLISPWSISWRPTSGSSWSLFHFPGRRWLAIYQKGVLISQSRASSDPSEIGQSQRQPRLLQWRRCIDPAFRPRRAVHQPGCYRLAAGAAARRVQRSGSGAACSSTVSRRKDDGRDGLSITVRSVRASRRRGLDFAAGRSMGGRTSRLDGGRAGIAGALPFA